MTTPNDSVNAAAPLTVSEYIGRILGWRRFIVWTTMLATCISLIVSLLLPNWYLATASILPPKDQGVLSSLGSAGAVLRNLSSITRGSMSSGSQGRYNYMAILKSRSAIESVVRKFDLVSVYDVPDSSIEKAMEELVSNVNFEVQEDDFITIDVLDKSPQRAADMANYFVNILNDMSMRMSTQEARSHREYLEAAVLGKQKALREGEEKLRKFQEVEGVLVTPDPDAANLAAVAELYALKARRELEIGILEKSVSKDHPTLMQMRSELVEINKRVDVIPAIGIEGLRLYREVLVQQKILEFIIPLYEQARVDENKNVPATVVLDRAVPPEKKNKPKRMMIVLLSAISGFIASAGWAMLSERMERWRELDPAGYDRLRSAVGLRRKRIS